MLISKNQKGVALLLVMSVIAILSFILFEFSFDTKLNRLKVFNQEDRFQARLNAEAGINFALAKLRLYKEGRNLIEKDDNKKSAFPPSELESILIEPFIYPIPISNKASIIQQNALKEFEKKTILKGNLSITITKISGLLNPNSLRVIDKKVAENSEVDQAKEENSSEENQENKDKNTNKTGENPPSNNDSPKENKWETAKNLFIKTLSTLFEDKLKKDEEFNNKHANTRIEDLINELIFYVNNKSKVQGQEFADARSKFNDQKITPRHGPMSSIEELYLLPSWDDSIIELIKDRMSVHELTSIPVNEINSNDLKILFPEINDMQIEEFFKHRDGDTDKKIKPSKFKNADDFKNIVVSKLNIISETDYKKRLSELKNAGLVIDVASKLYKINSKGTYNNASYTLIAIVDIPIKEAPPKKTDPKSPPPANQQENSNETQDENQNETEPQDQGENKDSKDKSPPLEFLNPRVVEIRPE